MTTPVNCPNCGSQLPPGAPSCARCGERFDVELDAPEAAAPVVQAPPEPPPMLPSAMPPPRASDARAALAETKTLPPLEVWRELIVGAALLREEVYARVRDDSQLTVVAAVALVGSMFLFAMGGWLFFVIELETSWEAFWKSVLVGTALGVGFWSLWVIVTRTMLSNMGHEIDVSQLYRVHAIASVPLAIGFAMLLPQISFGFALLAVVVWVLSSTLALQSAFGVTPRAAIISNLCGFAVWALVLPLLNTSENPIAPGIFWYDWTKDTLLTVLDAFEALSFTDGS